MATGGERGAGLRRRRRRLRQHQQAVPAEPDLVPRRARAVLRRHRRGAGQGAGGRLRRAGVGQRGAGARAPGRAAGGEPDHPRRARRGGRGRGRGGQARVEREAADAWTSPPGAALLEQAARGRGAGRLRAGHGARRGPADGPAADRLRGHRRRRSARSPCCRGRAPSVAPGPRVPVRDRARARCSTSGRTTCRVLATLFGPATRVAAIGRRARDTRVIGSGPRAGHRVRGRGAHLTSAVAEYASGQAASLLFSWDSPLQRHGLRRDHRDRGHARACPTRTGSTATSEVRRAGRRRMDVIASRGRGGRAGAAAWSTWSGPSGPGRPHRASGEMALHVLEMMTRSSGPARRRRSSRSRPASTRRRRCAAGLGSVCRSTRAS